MCAATPKGIQGQLPVSHQTIANFAFTKYDWVRKVEGMSLGS
jgi:hypothetical protein